MRNKSFYAILIAIAMAIFAGMYSGRESGILGFSFYSIYDLIGRLFLNALMLLVIPLVSASIISGISQMGEEKNFAQIGTKTILTFLGLNFLAVLTAWLLVSLLQSSFFAAADTLKITAAFTSLPAPVEIAGDGPFAQMLLKIIPSNIFAAFAESQILGIIFFSIILGLALKHIESAPAKTIKNFFQGLFQSMLFLTGKLMFFLPLGVFCLIAKTFASTGLETLKQLGYFSLFTLTGLLILFLVIFPLVLKFAAKVQVFKHFKAMLPAIVTAFSTSSSSATLPVTIECLEKNAKIPNKITSLVTPLATSVNLTGTALFVFLSVFFLAKASGLELNFSNQLMIFFLTFLTTLGVAPIPSGCLVSAMIILKALGLPVELIAPIFAIDRFLDMPRTTVNVFGNSVSTTVVAHLSGKTNT